MSALTPPRPNTSNDAKNATTTEKQRRSHSYPLNPYAEGSDDESACPLESVSNLSLSPRRGGGFNVSGGNNKRTDPWLRFRNVFSGRGFCDVAPSPSPSKDWQQQSSSPSLESVDTEDTSHASQGGGGCGADSASSSPLAAAPPAGDDGDVGFVGGGGGPVDEGTIAEAREAAMAAAAGAMAEAEAWRATTTAAVSAVEEEDEEVETETDEDDGGGSSEDEYTDDGEEEGSDESVGVGEMQDHKASLAHDSTTSNKEEGTVDDSAHVTAADGCRREASLVAVALAISVGILAVAHRRDGGGGATTSVPTATMKAPQLDAPLPKRQQRYPNLDVDISDGLDGTEDDVSKGISPQIVVDEDDEPEVDGEEKHLSPDSEGGSLEMETEELVVEPTQCEHGISSSMGVQDYEPENEEAEQQVVHDAKALSEESVEESLSNAHEENVAETANEDVPMELKESDDDDVAEVHDVDFEEDILSDVGDYVATGIEAEGGEAPVDDIKEDAGGSRIALDEERGKQWTESQQHTEEGTAGQDAREDDSEHVQVANPAFVPMRQRAGPTTSPERRWGVKTAAGGDNLHVGGGTHDLPETDSTRGEEGHRPKEDVSSETDDTFSTTVPEESVAISTHTRIDWKGVLRDLVSDATFTMRI